MFIIQLYLRVDYLFTWNGEAEFYVVLRRGVTDDVFAKVLLQYPQQQNWSRVLHCISETCTHYHRVRCKLKEKILGEMYYFVSQLATAKALPPVGYCAAKFTERRAILYKDVRGSFTVYHSPVTWHTGQ